MPRLKLLLLLSLLALPLGLLAQIKVFPHEGVIKKSSESTRIRSTQLVPVGLPFWDDFSFTPESANPLDSLWFDNSRVIVSSGLAIRPPSIHVATFDGLDANGEPYSPAPGDEQVFGYRDTLVSQPVTLNSVVIANRDSVYLSFSFQAGGNGEPPDQSDFLRIDFLDDDNEWHEALTLTVDDAPDPTKFYDTTIHIVGDTLFHPNFQFRFISFGRKSGRYDTWHIDYVYLNEHRYANDKVFPDRTMSEPLGPIFGNYYAKPIEHFFKRPTVTNAQFAMSNRYDEPTVVVYNSRIKSEKFYEFTGPDVHEINVDTLAPMFAVVNVFPAFSTVELSTRNMPDSVVVFDPTAERIKLTMSIMINNADDRPYNDPFGTDYEPKFEPIRFRSNDTIRTEYALDSAYAYDDGTAEYSAGLVRAGNELVYRFEHIHSGQDSILNGVLFYFPTFAGSASATNINFFVMSDSIGFPKRVIYEDLLPIERTTNNEFTPYRFTHGIHIDSAFYIGYREPSTGSVRVGLDKSNDTGDRMFFRVNSNSTTKWTLNNEVTGSLMIRPTFGPHTLIISGLPEEGPPVSIFPNPSRGEFYIQGLVSDIQLMSITGQLIPIAVENADDRIKVSSSVNSPGVYVLRYRSGSRPRTQKVLFVR